MMHKIYCQPVHMRMLPLVNFSEQTRHPHMQLGIVITNQTKRRSI